MFQTIHLLTFTPRSFCAKIAALWHPIMWWIVQNSRICLLVIPGLYSLYTISSYTICMQHSSRYRVIFSDIDTDHQVQKKIKEAKELWKKSLQWSFTRLFHLSVFGENWEVPMIYFTTLAIFLAHRSRRSKAVNQCFYSGQSRIAHYNYFSTPLDMLWHMSNTVVIPAWRKLCPSS